MFPKWMPFFKKMKFLQNNVADYLGCLIKFEDLKATENRVLIQVVFICIMTIILPVWIGGEEESQCLKIIWICY